MKNRLVMQRQVNNDLQEIFSLFKLNRLAAYLLIGLMTVGIGISCKKNNSDASLLDAPTLDSPADGEVGLPHPVTVSWNAVSNADGYALQIGTDNGFETVISEKSRGDISGTSYSFTKDDGAEDSTTYYWRVRALSDTDNYLGSPWSEARNFKTVDPTKTAPATAPVLMSPASADTVAFDEPISLMWEALRGSEMYSLQLDTDSNFSAPILVDRSGLDDVTFTFNDGENAPNAVAGTTYYWRVRGVNTGGQGPWSVTRNFVAGTPPSVPVIVTPLDTATGVQYDSVRFEWTSTAKLFQIQVAGSNVFTQGQSSILTLLELLVNKQVDTLTYVYTSGDIDDTYYWRVRAIGDGGKSNWTDVQSFTTNTVVPRAPVIPTLALTAPHRNVLLEWDQVFGAVEYTIDIVPLNSPTSMPSTTDTIESVDGVLPTTYTFMESEPRVSYEWTVFATNSRNEDGPASETATFTTGYMPTTPNSVVTADTLLLGDDVVFRWTEATTNRGTQVNLLYDIQISTSQAFSEEGITFEDRVDSDSTTISVDDDNTFMDNSLYYWRVRAVDTHSLLGGYGNWSTTRSFIVVNPTTPSLSDSPPILVSPNDSADFSTEQTVSFEWSNDVRATYYRLRIDTLKDFSTTDTYDVVSNDTTFTSGSFKGEKTYYWGVRAHNASDSSGWSTTRSFTVITAPLNIFGSTGIQTPFGFYIRGNGNSFADQDITARDSIVGLGVTYEQDKEGNDNAALTARFDGTDASEVFVRETNSNDLSSYSNGSLWFELRVNNNIPTTEQLKDSLSWNVQLGESPNHAPVSIETDVANLAADTWKDIEIPLSCFDSAKQGSFNIEAVSIPFLISIGSGAGASEDFPAQSISIANIRISAESATSTRTSSGCPSEQN